MEKLIGLLCTIVMIKILAFYITAKVKEQPKTKLYAEDIIMPGYEYKEEKAIKRKQKRKTHNYSIPVGMALAYLKTPSKKKLQEEKLMREAEEEEMIQKRIDLLYEINQCKLKINYKDRDPEIEEYSNIVSKLFSDKVKGKKLKRDHILTIRNYLHENVNEYEKKRFTNDAHAIYCMLKAKDISNIHLEEIERFIKER